eukprot:402013_1
MSSTWKRRHELTAYGYTRDQSNSYKIIIPLELTELVFLFYHYWVLSYEYPKALMTIDKEKNIITQIRYLRSSAAIFGNPMISGTPNIFGVKMKIKKVKHWMAVGIVPKTSGYKTNCWMHYIPKAYFYHRHGSVGFDGSKYASINTHEYCVGDTLQLLFDCSLSNISYVLNKMDGKEQKGILLDNICPSEYRWGVSFQDIDDSIEIIDITEEKSHI